MTRILYLTNDPDSVSAQLQPNATAAAHIDIATPARNPPHRPSTTPRGTLRDDISTDEITPVAVLSHYDHRLGDFAHTGFSASGQMPIARGALRAAGIEVLVAGKRYGKGSSREHSPMAEKLAGVKLVIAESFERIYRQNADNIGLFTSTDLSLAERIAAGEWPSLDVLLAGREPLAAAILRAGGLLQWGQQHLADAPLAVGPAAPLAARLASHSAAHSATHSAAPLAMPPPGATAATPHRPLTLAEKILQRARLQVTGTPEDPQPGDGLFVRADWRFIHEYYTGMGVNMMDEALGNHYSFRDAQSIVVFEDHTSYIHESPAHAKNGLVPNVLAMAQAQRNFVARHGLTFHRTLTDAEAAQDSGENLAGISHAMMAERYALPGQVVAGTDSHTPHSGALGCLAFGVGTTDMANAFLTGAVRFVWPHIVRVELDGSLPLGVTAKDVVLHLLALPTLRAGSGLGKIFEFCGSGVAALSIDERATLTNMTAEMGGLTGIVAPDAETVAFLRARRGVDFTIEPWMHSDPGAHYAERLHIDARTLSPMLARPGDPGNGVAVDALDSPVPIDIAYGGSCTAGKREDFDNYHAVFAWAMALGLRVPPHVQVFLQYGTTAVRDYCISRGYDKTFAHFGVRILQPSCGACANCGPGSSERTDQVTVSAINRNFPGRSGPGQVWLASPPTVIASALAGELMSWQRLRAKLGA
jgi:3-isopropylmalate/(R)-2-methylmalate dehydratase large subunit